MPDRAVAEHHKEMDNRDKQLSENEYRKTLASDRICPLCLKRTYPARYDGGTWTHHCGAILKIGNLDGLTPTPDDHRNDYLYIWLVARRIQVHA